ncbi:MAG: hypothetical protein QOJ13_955 [Gaiellales bacterium]|jgi:hypothetical protein|nr:hypothetical protein [Gaiellales bacterium]
MSDSTIVTEVKPLFSERRDEAGQLVGYSIHLDGQVIGKVTKLARTGELKKGQLRHYWQCQVGRTRKVANTRADAVMAAIPGSVVAR